MMKKDETLSITTETKGKPPRLPFVDIKNEILGKKYELSILFAAPRTSQKLNKKYRGKNKPTNILSFPLSKTSGEIVIELTKVAEDAPKFGLSSRAFLAYLLIHGMVHLKGYEHGSTMDRLERRYGKKLGIKIPQS